MDTLKTEKSETGTNHQETKKNYSPLKEANNSKVIQTELLLKDIKAAALKRANSYSGKENQNEVLEESVGENIGEEQESLENSKPIINDPTNCLGQNGNACICEDLFAESDNKEIGLENGIKNEVSSFKDENKDSSIHDNVTSETILSSESSENSSLQNTQESSVSQQVIENDQKEADPSERRENDQNESDNDILNQEKILSNNEDSSEIESSEIHIENGEDTILLNGTSENEEISLRLSKTIKNDSEREQTSPTSVKEFVKLKVIQDIIQEDKKLMEFTEKSILSGNIAIKKPDHIEIMTDKEPVYNGNDDKDNSPNFTSSVSEEEETLEEGICIIINGKRLPPASESELENLRNSNERVSTISKDGIDPDQSSSSVFESIEETIDVTDSVDYSASVSDQGSTSRENSISQSQSSTKTDILTAILDMTNKTKLGKIKTSKMPDPPTENEYHLRPIIHNFLGDTTRRPVRTQSLNIKSVRFSQDTVFNEDKTKRYRKERASLRNIYRNRITGAETYGKINPLFEDDSDEGESYVTKGHLPLERRGSFIYHGDDETSSNENAEGDSSIDEAVLNFPAYMQRFLQNESNTTTAIAKLTNGNNSGNKEIQGSSGNRTSENLSSSSKSNGKFDNAETPTIKITKPDKDENHVGTLVPGYDALIKKTIAKQQHHYFMKCSLGILFVLGLLAIVAIIVYFLIIKR